MGNNPVNFVDPFGLWSMVGGVGGSFITAKDPEAKSAYWRNKEINVGAMINYGVGESKADLGVFGAVGQAGGFNVGINTFAGFVRGQQLQGHANNLNLVLGPVEIVVILNKYTNSFQGLMVGVGPSIPLGFSASESITGDLTFREVMSAIDKWLKGEHKNNNCKNK